MLHKLSVTERVLKMAALQLSDLTWKLEFQCSYQWILLRSLKSSLDPIPSANLTFLSLCILFNFCLLLLLLLSFCIMLNEKVNLMLALYRASLFASSSGLIRYGTYCSLKAKIRTQHSLCCFQSCGVMATLLHIVFSFECC